MLGCLREYQKGLTAGAGSDVPVGGGRSPAEGASVRGGRVVAGSGPAGVKAFSTRHRGPRPTSPRTPSPVDGCSSGGMVVTVRRGLK